MKTKVYNNDVFISYRRNKGEAWASLIKELLEKKGLKVYLDKHKKRTIDFKESLLRNINESNNFLMILSEDVFEKREDDFDWVREEIKYAKRNNKNIVGVIFNGYDPAKVNWKEEDEDVAFIETLECLQFVDTNLELRDASIKTILNYLVDEEGKPWHEKSIDNNAWYGNGITQEDRLWMSAHNEVCRKIDYQAMSKIFKNPIFASKKQINYFNLLAYDIETLKQRVYSDKNNIDIPVNVYGFCHDFDLEEAENTFGKNHFIPFTNEKDVVYNIKKLFALNDLSNFDIVEMTLVLKDVVSPEKIMRDITDFLNPQGAACFIRDLDDDLVVAYPDPENLIGRLVEYLSLDPGAGNRHFGKKIYNFLKKSGAEEIYMIDTAVTTANFNPKLQRKICDAYFSYLIPEFKVLVRDNPSNEEYIAALNWLEQRYEKDVLSLFSSDEFYFRAGYISGVAIYKDDKFFDDDF